MWSNRRLFLTGSGLGLALLGLVIASFCFNRLLDANARGYLGALQSEPPVRQAAAIRCPAEWASGEAGSVTATIDNTYTTQEMGYSLYFLMSAGGESLGSPQSFRLKTTIPAGQRVNLSLPSIRPPDDGYYEFVSLQAIADADAQNPFFDRPNSYSASCSIRLSASPALQAQIRWLLLDLACVVLGVALWYSANQPLKRWRSRILTGLAVLVVLVFEYGTCVLVFATPR